MWGEETWTMKMKISQIIHSTKTMSSTEEQIIKLETRVSEIRGVLVSNGLQEDFSREFQKIVFDFEL